MTCTPVWTVWCDADPGTGSDCFQFCQLSEKTAPVAREKAKAAGWKRIGNKDVCPNCQRGGRTVAHGVRR